MKRALMRLVAAFIAITLGVAVAACEFRGPVPTAVAGVGVGR
jgi:hypothetical protein